MLVIDRIGMPPPLLAALKHLASVSNPDFYDKERLRHSTYGTPRLIRCYQETLDQLLLPRGLRDKASTLAAEAGSRLDITAAHPDTPPIEVALVAALTPEQEAAADKLAAHDLGMLVAPPGSGKTVIGCALIAHHQTPTLVVVDRKPLVDQWRDRLTTTSTSRPSRSASSAAAAPGRRG